MAQSEVTAPGGQEALPWESAYAALLAEIKAVPDSELVPINIDVMTALTTVLGSLPEIRALRPEIEATFRSFDLEGFDRLEQYALALNHAHSLFRAATEPKRDTVELASELSKLRDRLLADAQSLANHGLIDGGRLKDCRQVPGYRPMASDILMLSTVFKDNWPAIEGKTPTTLAQINDAASKAMDLLSAVGLRDQGPVVVGDATVLRQKAFTLFTRAYDSARRAVQFLRTNPEEADAIAPSLYAGRGGTRRTEPAPAPGPVAGAASTALGTPGVSFAIDNKAGLPITNPLSA